jgi:catechol 2,3-dioxygenase-like lactoylglutathione lyase family enzyme
MLDDYPVDVILLATDLRASRSFYADRLGLEIDREDAGAVRFNCGGGSQISLSASTTGTADTQTQASWRVGDLGAELARLRSRGVEILEYDTPGLSIIQYK